MLSPYNELLAIMDFCNMDFLKYYFLPYYRDQYLLLIVKYLFCYIIIRTITLEFYLVITNH